jgi:hypothetical protein
MTVLMKNSSALICLDRERASGKTLQPLGIRIECTALYNNSYTCFDAALGNLDTLE